MESHNDMHWFYKIDFHEFLCLQITTVTLTSSYYILMNYMLQGDSGGPLVILIDDTYNLIGIVSFGADTGCEQGSPVAFTRVTSYLSWIASIPGTRL
jgi:secreted trypsin-like serine protease